VNPQSPDRGIVLDLNENQGSGQDFQERCFFTSEILHEVVAAKGNAGDYVGAFACAVGSDIAYFQGIMWDSLAMSSGDSLRRYFQLGEQVIRALQMPSTHALESISEAVNFMRTQVEPVFTASDIHGWRDSMSDSDDFINLPCPAKEELSEATTARLHGLAPSEYVRKQNQAASEISVQAFTAVNASHTDEAIRLMYASDFTALDAYLVESADAVGDHELLTVHIRWELAVCSAARIKELPQSFSQALATTRSGMTALMSENDAARFLASLPSV
jgi:hypothetical protein